MTLDGSFVLGAAVFAKLTEIGLSDIALPAALLSGMLAGMGVALIQHHKKIDPLLAGILATFILISINLIIMGRPNISLLSQTSNQIIITLYSINFCALVSLLLLSRHGLLLRAFGDNENLLQRLGKSVEMHRIFGFALTNCLAALSGCLTAQTVGYADIGMGFGVTLTALGAVILGKQLLSKYKIKIAGEFLISLTGVLFYFFAINSLLRLDLNPIYLKMVLGIILIIFLRTAKISSQTRPA